MAQTAPQRFQQTAMRQRPTTFSTNGPNIEIMPSGVPSTFYMQPANYHDAQLRAALVELKHTLERWTELAMNPDAIPLIEAATHEIKKNRLILEGKQDFTMPYPDVHDTGFGVTITDSSPLSIPQNNAMNPVITSSTDMNYDSAMSVIEESQDISIDNIDWDLI